MKYPQKEFNSDLRKLIKNKEKVLTIFVKEYVKNNKPILMEEGLLLEAEFVIEGNDPFIPGYNSSISVGISESEGEPLDIHIIYIWECNSTFLGVPIGRWIPGSKITGELIDETVEEIEQELTLFLEELVSDCL
ncbi:hypothetical protein [Niallia taxi]|uniref:hypothetical protein n=1 Tax=Niallia taxi TaxID=2499688 RepID=UPI002E1EFD09|nr:hypothetical protein [Niallia taxi]